MAQLGIKGNYTNCKEVIQLLEMLDGVNVYNLEGSVDSYCYYIDDSNKICSCLSAYAENFIVYTLEEFIEKFPYKVGDKVIYEDKIREITKMVWEELTNTIAYKLDDKLYYNVTNDLQPYKEENYCQVIGNDTSSNGVNTSASSIDEEPEPEPKAPILSNRYDYAEGKCGYVIPDGYEFDSIKEGFQTEIILKPKKPTYPKDYVECCECLKHNPFINNVSGYRRDAIEALLTLITCRDAYWKISGEEFGLGKPWEYDMSKDEFAYAIVYQYGYIQKCEVRYKNHILAFPTSEMRDYFYDNFKDLIEQCKELL